MVAKFTDMSATGYGLKLNVTVWQAILVSFALKLYLHQLVFQLNKNARKKTENG